MSALIDQIIAEHGSGVTASSKHGAMSVWHCEGCGEEAMTRAHHIAEVAVREQAGGVTLWRCVRCGKWSHAKRKPKLHQRFVMSPGLGDVIVSHETGDMYEDGGYFIQCGPFEEWAARPAGGGGDE